MSELFAWLGISVVLCCVCIVGCLFMLRDKISDLTREIWELRMDSKRGANDDNT